MSVDAVCHPETFLEQSPACNWVVDGDGVFLQVYGDAAALFERPAGELAGQNVAILGAEPAKLWRGRFARALGGETVLVRERRGKSTWSVSLFPIRVEGRIRYAGGSATEITLWTTAEKELRYTVLGALKAQEYERRTASRFLHDTVGQNLTALGLQLDLVRMDLEAGQLGVQEQIVEIQKLLESIMEQVREYSYELNPSTVERAGLRPALDRLEGRIRQRFAGNLRINVDPSLKLDPKIATAMYHVAQEALENAVQHAACSAVEIAVKSTRSGPYLEVRDNGRGFDPGEAGAGSRGLGLLTMEHYAVQAGLDLSIRSSPQTGTVVRLAPAPPARPTGGDQ